MLAGFFFGCYWTRATRGNDVVRLFFNEHGWAFHDGLRSIIDSYDAAHLALEERATKALHEIDDYAEALSNGAEWEGEEDKDGFIVWSKEQILDYQHGLAVENGSTLRKAFVITLYHHWERSALKWVDQEYVKHYALVEMVREMGYPVAEGLEDLYLLTNLIKHNRRTWGEKLANKRLDLFWLHKRPADTIKHWDGQVRVGPHHMNEFFQIVGMSGPEADMPVEQQNA